jgi:hypothetical protein
MPDFAQRIADAPSAFLAALPDALGDVLDEMVREHGSVHGYVLSLGVGPAAIEALASEFLVRP